MSVESFILVMLMLLIGSLLTATIIVLLGLWLLEKDGKDNENE